MAAEAASDRGFILCRADPRFAMDPLKGIDAGRDPSRGEAPRQAVPAEAGAPR